MYYDTGNIIHLYAYTAKLVTTYIVLLYIKIIEMGCENW